VAAHHPGPLELAQALGEDVGARVGQAGPQVGEVLGAGQQLPGDQERSSLGRYAWDGGDGTSWYVDPKEELIGILISQRFWNSPVLRASFSILNLDLPGNRGLSLHGLGLHATVTRFPSNTNLLSPSLVLHDHLAFEVGVRSREVEVRD
jgi:hypothetical protein